MKKRIVAVLMATALVATLGLSACGSSEEKEEKTEEKAEEKEEKEEEKAEKDEEKAEEDEAEGKEEKAEKEEEKAEKEEEKVEETEEKAEEKEEKEEEKAEKKTADAGDGKDYELTFSMHTAADSYMGYPIQDLFADINDHTSGHVNITIYGSGTLAASGDVADMIVDGGCDMGWIFTGFYPGQYPLSDVISIPLQGAQSSYQGTEVLWDLYDKYPEMADEWSNYKVIAMYANPVNYIYTDTDISSVEEIKGKPIRVTSGAMAEVLANYGVDGISMAPNDIYDGMSKNNIWGFVAEPTMIDDYALVEVAPYMIDIKFYQAPFVIAMNWDTYNSLPEEYQEIIDEFSGRETSLELAAAVDDAIEQCLSDYQAGGAVYIEMTEEDTDTMLSARDEYVESWVEQYTTDSFDAQAYYDECTALYEQYAE